MFNHVEQLRPVLADAGDVVAFVQAGFVGTWGEFYYTDSFGKPGTTLTNQNILDRRTLIEKLLDVVPNGVPGSSTIAESFIIS